MNRPIPTSIHGVLDYLSVPALLVLPRALHWNKNLTNLLTGAALGTLGASLFTRYELGLVKSIPMKTHLALDLVTGATIAAAPFLLPEKSSRQTGIAATLLGLGAFEVTAALLTKQYSPLELETSPLNEAVDIIKHKVKETVHSKR